MAVVKIAWSRQGAIYSGLFSDTKPTSGVGLQPGSLFIESDTGRVFAWDGTNWSWPGVRMEPVTGGFNITNIYVNSAGRLVIEYDDTPE